MMPLPRRTVDHSVDVRLSKLHLTVLVPFEDESVFATLVIHGPLTDEDVVPVVLADCDHLAIHHALCFAGPLAATFATKRRHGAFRGVWRDTGHRYRLRHHGLYGSSPSRGASGVVEKVAAH